MTARPTSIGAALLAAFRAAFHSDATELTPELLRTIGNSYQSCAERRVASGLEQTPPMRKLRVAMEAYVAVHPEAEAALFGPKECPF